ncbi:MAG: hypothetical protein J7K40_01745 [candidate division Zixibacteria bacterium]|nr:hypothetical protein [candidate division Zixibacteria bacterium]
MKTLFALLVSAILLAPSVIQAQPCHLLAMADELNLTDNQIEQLSASIIAFKKETVQIRADMKKAEIELQEIMLQKQINKKAALKKSDEISAMKAQMRKKQLSDRIDKLNILDGKQRAEVRKIMMLKGHGPRRGHEPFEGQFKYRGKKHGERMLHKRGMDGDAEIDIIIEEKFADFDDGE